jgi:hypothetical protein
VLLLLAAGTLSLRRDSGLMSLLDSPHAGGASLRVLLPATVLVPLVAGRVTLALTSNVSQQATVSVFALSIAVVLALAVWFNAAFVSMKEPRHS